MRRTAARLSSFWKNLRPLQAAGDCYGEVCKNRGSELFIFLKRDHGALLQVSGRPGKATQYEIGNPPHCNEDDSARNAAAPHAPLRVVLYENAAGRATYEYDRPSTLFGQFGDRQVTAAGRELDAEAERALRRAAE